MNQTEQKLRSIAIECYAAKLFYERHEPELSWSSCLDKTFQVGGGLASGRDAYLAIAREELKEVV